MPSERLLVATAAAAAAALVGGVYYRRLRAALATAHRALAVAAESTVRAQPLLGRVALVTGAGAGIGRGVALALANAGAAVVLNDISQAAADETAAQCRAHGAPSVSIVAADVSDEDAGERMVAHARSQHGRLDCVVANAAFSERAPLVEQDAKDTRRTIEVNQFGALQTLRAAARAMRRQRPLDGSESRGKMVIVSSIMGQVVLSQQAAAYSMSKAAVRHLGACLASELIDARINVNTICPGWVDTPGERKFTSEADIAQLGARMPWGRLGKPSEIGKAVVFLCSEDAAYITGSTLVVDGGYTVSTRLAFGSA
jgi:glucose 1-dehydrogenase